MPDPVVSPPLGKPRHSLARGALASLLGTTAAWGTWKGLDNLWERLRPKKEPQRMQFVRGEDGSIILEKVAAAVTQHARNRRKLTLGEFTSGVARFGVYKSAQAKANADMAFDELGEQMGKAHSPTPPKPPVAPAASKNKAQDFFKKMDTDPATKTYNLRNQLPLKKTSSFLGDVADALENMHSRAVDATEGLIDRAAKHMGVHYDQLADAEVSGHREALKRIAAARESALATRGRIPGVGLAPNSRLFAEALGQQNIRDMYARYNPVGTNPTGEAYDSALLRALRVGMRHTGGGARSALPDMLPPPDPRISVHKQAEAADYRTLMRKTGQTPPSEYAPGGTELVRPRYVTGKTPGWEYRESIPSGNNLGTSHLKKWFPKKDRSGRQTTDEGGNLEWKKNWRLEEVGPDTTPARFKFVHDKRPLPPALQKVKEVFNKKPALDRVAPDTPHNRHKKTASLPSALRAATALLSRSKGRAAMHNWAQTVGSRRDPAAFGFRYDPAKDPALLRMGSRLEGKVLASRRDSIAPDVYQRKLYGIRDARPAVNPGSSWGTLQNRLAVYKQRKASGFPRQPGRAEMLESIRQRRLAAPRLAESSLAAPVEIQAGAAGPVPVWQRPRPVGRSF